MSVLSVETRDAKMMHAIVKSKLQKITLLRMYKTRILH